MPGVEAKVKYLSTGFSLIELMVVIAIIGVLAMIAIPAYDSYVLRAKSTHLSAIGNTVQKAITEYRALNGAFPERLSEAVTLQQSKYAVLNGLDMATGGCVDAFAFTVSGEGIFGNTTTMPVVKYIGTYSAPSDISPGGINWRCEVYTGTNVVPSSFMPECDRAGSQIATGTTCG